MSKAFREAFPTLKLEEELEGLLDTTEVTKISANHEHTHIRIYLRAKRLIFKKNIWKLEKAITEQIFQNRAIQVKIIESYELSEQYTPKSLIEVYKDSILEELKAYSLMEYNLLRASKMEFTDDSHLHLVLENTIIAQTRSHEIVEFLEKIVCERCGMNLIVDLDFEEPKESRYKTSWKKGLVPAFPFVSNRLFVAALWLGTAVLLRVFRFKNHINIPASGLQFVVVIFEIDVAFVLCGSSRKQLFLFCS